MDISQKRERCNLMEVTLEIGMPLLSLHPRKKRRNTSLFDIAVLGYDTSLPEDEVKSILTEHVSSCGVITHPQSEVTLALPPVMKLGLAIDYSIPAHFIEFAPEINNKLNDYMTEWRVKAGRERVKARREQKFKASKVLKKMACRARNKEISMAMIRMEREKGSSFEKM
ncbi:Uncharacterized protein Rs2_18012 [Raphanus sativus]|nr:Uncharacterized protein Rs2_18012 [Raphanus sativus]